MSINVLVYNGPGVSQTSLTHTLQSLRALLRPNYSINPITAEALISQPWPPTCALLVIPGGRDLPYVQSLAKANPRIREYVRNGGSFLGICAGGYYASARVEWEMGTALEVVGSRELGFFPGTCKGCVYKGFVYESEDGAHAIDVKVDDTTYHGLYYNGGGLFEDAEKFSRRGVRVLATYPDKGNAAAAVVCDVGEGRAILWGPHLEYSLEFQPAVAARSKRAKPLDVAEAEKARWRLMKETLELLGLRSPYKTAEEVPTKSVGPLPQVLVATPSKLHIMDVLVRELDSIKTGDLIEDANDTFHLRVPVELVDLVRKAREETVSEEDFSTIRRELVVFGDGALPDATTTPLFNIKSFFDALEAVRATVKIEPGGPETWGMGEALLYGEIITSTQTLLDKNPTLLRALPSPILSLASHQLTGRGRGSNVWLSPSGCLQFSLLLRPPRTFRPASLVFVQYLFGLAVVEACRRVMPGGAGEQVRLKWPNDVYALVKNAQTGKEELKKLGGILVTTNFSGGLVDVVIGCGVNVLNPLPTTSLSQLLPPGAPPLTMEGVAATIMPVFQSMWEEFLQGGGSFEPFLDLYLTRWLHSDQLVTLTTTTPHQSVRIVGITPDYGLLRTVPVSSTAGRGQQYIDLQPDGNSFDMMAGLIRLKT